MQPPVSDATKRAVIEEYLRGKKRDQISIDLRVGTGTVSKIISEWKTGLNYPIADELRELALGLQKLGISASRYAEGARIASYLIKFGVNDEEFHHFVSEIYDRCKKMDLQPDKVASLLKQLFDLSESVPLQQIPEYIERQTSRNGKLKQEIEELEQKILDAKSRLDIVLNEEATTRDELNQFSSFKTEMKKNGVDMLDNPRFMRGVIGAKSLGFDPRVMVEKLSNIQRLEIDQKALEEKVEFLGKQSQKLEQTRDNLEKEALVHNYRISIYQDLDLMGMGIKELKLLWNTIKEIAAVNNISANEASKKFYSDVIEQYDNKLGFEGKIQNLNSEIQKHEVVQCQLSATTAMFNSIILNQYDQIQAVSGFVEFGPLVKAAKGQTVPKNQLKNAVIKAIDILIKTDPNDHSNRALNVARLLLLEDIQKSGDIA
jgi:uncharacterized protein YeeX (DUF496 family)